METKQTMLLKNIKEQIEHRKSQKYNWKRIPFGELEKIQRRFLRLFFLHYRESKSTDQLIDIGTDDLGRDVALGLKEYVHLLKCRGVLLHTLLVLGSRAKRRGKSGSDVDVMVIASNLPGKSMPKLTNFPQKLLNIRRWLLLSDAPLFMGIQPSGCCSREEFLVWLKDLNILTLDALYYGIVVYDDGFWENILELFKNIEKKFGLQEMNIKKRLLVV